MEASKKLGYVYSINEAPLINAFFPGNLEDTEVFLKNNNGLNFKTTLVKDQDYFIKASSGSFPSIFLVDESSKVIKHWIGDQMNFTALDEIATYTH
jgi:hypothetical protein